MLCRYNEAIEHLKSKSSQIVDKLFCRIKTAEFLLLQGCSYDDLVIRLYSLLNHPVSDLK